MMDIKISNLVTSHVSCLFFQGLLRRFRLGGFKTELISSPGNYLNQVAKNEGAEPVAIQMKREIAPIKDIVSLWNLYRHFRSTKPMIVNAGTAKAGLLGMLAATFAGVPLRIFQQRGLRLETTTGLKFLILWMTDKITCLCAHRIICNSESLRQRLISLHLTTSQKSLVLGHGSSKGVDSNRFRITQTNLVSAQRLQQELGILPNQIVLGCVARLTRDKGIEELFTSFKIALKKYPNLCLLLVGPEEKGDSISETILSEMKNHPKVLFAGECSDVVPYYTLMDIFVFPSHREGFPNAVLEALSMGLPVVGTRATGVIDAIVHEETGLLVDVNNSEALAEGILRYLQEPALRMQHGLNGRCYVMKFFQPEKIVNAYYNEIKELLQSKNLPVPEPVTPFVSSSVIDTETDTETDTDESDVKTWFSVKQHWLHENEEQSELLL